MIRSKQIPVDEREKLEKQVFKRSLDEIWAETVKFFTERDPEQIARANNNPKRKMALIFRWYLGLSSRWSASGEKGRELDYQVWCGPSIGPFNDWTRGTYLAEPQQPQSGGCGAADPDRLRLPGAGAEPAQCRRAGFRAPVGLLPALCHDLIARRANLIPFETVCPF